MSPAVLRTLAYHQLAWFIRNGRHVDECKAEWRRRWALDYPAWKTARGAATWVP